MNSDLKNNSNPAFSGESLLTRFSSFFYYISKVGQYEALILWRSWLFRIFSLLILAILVLFDVFGVLGIAESEAWSGRYMWGGVFYMNFYLFTVAQVVIAAFLSADFLGRERKMDTTEVFYTRPMSNLQYVLGKTWGSLMVFMGLNMVVALLATVVTLISPDAVFVWQAIFIYPFIFSLPSLVFILGFSFVLMVLVRNQAVAFVIVLGFGGMVLFYLGNMHWGIWDFIGFFIPGYYSGFCGLSNPDYLLFQRGGYFLLGLLGILLTAFFLPRLPGTRRRSGSLLLFCVVLTGGAAFLFFNIVSKGIDGQDLRERIRGTEKLLPALPAYSVDSCYLRVHHDGNDLINEARLLLKEKRASDTLFLHLNPGFEISSVTLNNQQVPFTFSGGIIAVGTSLVSEDDSSGITCKIVYSGHPDQEAIYPEFEKEREALSRFEPLIGGKEHFFIRSDYVLLTQESGWYPKVAWRNFRQQPDFTNYVLDFSSGNNLEVISQGAGVDSGEMVRYSSGKPLNALTLIAGYYKTDTLLVDGVEYSLSIHRDNDLFEEAFGELGDTIPVIIRDLKGQYERGVGLEYPFERLKLIEVPVHFYTYLHSWRTGTDHIQPEMVLIPENGGGRWFLDVGNTLNDFKEEAESQGEEVDEQEVQTKTMMTMAGNLFFYPQWNVFSGSEADGRLMTEWNRLQIFPLYYYHAYQIREEGWPVFQIMMDEALRQQAKREKNEGWRAERDQYKGLLALRERSISEWLTRENAGDTVAGILNLKGIHFFSKISAQNSQDDFVGVFESAFSRFRFQTGSPEQWIEMAGEGGRLKEEYQSVVTGEELAAFQFGNVKASTFRNQGKKQFLVSLEVSNTGNVDGILNTETAFLDLSENNNRSFSQWRYQALKEEDNTDKKFYVVGAGEQLRIKLVYDNQPRELKVFTGVSRNIPPVFVFPFTNIGEELFDLNPKEGVENVDFEIGKQDGGQTYVVDNEDVDFEINSRDEVKTLKDLWLRRERKKADKYEMFYYWRPQAVWTNTLAQNYYGDYLRSAVLKASGNGNDMARWKCELPEAGRYEIQVYIPTGLNTGWRSRNSGGRFHYLIHHANGEEKVETPPVRERSGWVSLGRFFFNEGDAVVELSDESEFPYVVADAVKWVRTDG